MNNLQNLRNLRMIQRQIHKKASFLSDLWVSIARFSRKSKKKRHEFDTNVCHIDTDGRKMTDFDKSKIENGILEMKNPKAIFAVFYEECMIIWIDICLLRQIFTLLDKSDKSWYTFCL